MKMEQTVFRNVGIQNSDAGELPRRKHTTFRTWQKFEIEDKTSTRCKRLWWSRGSVLFLSTQVRGFKPGRSRQDFSGRKNPQRPFLQRGNKAIGPLSQICGM
jgi:hypothetical protein